MILSDTEILNALGRGEIVIEPFDINQLGGNSYDVRLAPVLRVYESSALWTAAASWGETVVGEDIYGAYQLNDIGAFRRKHSVLGVTDNRFLDSAVEPQVLDVKIPEDGIVLVPGVLYLASTMEYTETHRHVPYLDGRSSIGRLGMLIHATAGRGDVGFAGVWTCEISVVQPLRIYAGMPIGQLTYHTVEGEVERRYQSKVGASYKDGHDPLPQPSRLWRKLHAQRRCADCKSEWKCFSGGGSCVFKATNPCKAL